MSVLVSVSKSDSHTRVAVISFLIETLLCHDIRRILLLLQITSALTIANNVVEYYFRSVSKDERSLSSF